ncbi:MAG: M23 family metallopeptidase, partial [Cyanobacteria bacterium P01_D01_bin.73]
LERLETHTVGRGETLEAIAQQYQVQPATIMGFNPTAQDGQVRVGDRLQIPPFDGIKIPLPSGQTWQEIAQQYSARADVIYDLNGCPTAQNLPSHIFIPGITWSPPSATGTIPSATDAANPLTRYPLPETGRLLVGYGWRFNIQTGRRQFNSGIVLAAGDRVGVSSTGDGTVAFAGAQEGYGTLIVVNHANGLQTRYGNLERVAVKAGQRVSAGDRLGQLAPAIGPSNTSYLIFEVRYNSPVGWIAQNPQPYLRQMQGQVQQLR